MDFKVLYFETPEPGTGTGSSDEIEYDLTEVIVEKEVKIKIGNLQLKYVKNYGDLGGDPEKVEFKFITGKKIHHKAGMEDVDTWDVEFYYNKAEYTALKALMAADSEVDIEVEFTDGSKFTNRGKVSAIKKSGGDAGEAGMATFSVDVSGDWELDDDDD